MAADAMSTLSANKMKYFCAMQIPRTKDDIFFKQKTSTAWHSLQKSSYVWQVYVGQHDYELIKTVAVVKIAQFS